MITIVITIIIIQLHWAEETWRTNREQISRHTVGLFEKFILHCKNIERYARRVSNRASNSFWLIQPYNKYT